MGLSTSATVSCPIASDHLLASSSFPENQNAIFILGMGWSMIRFEGSMVEIAIILKIYGSTM